MPYTTGVGWRLLSEINTETRTMAREMTLAEHAEAWWREQGNALPARETDKWERMYEAWVEWAFIDLRSDEHHRRGQRSKRLMS
jgi:hypothetical protein